MATHFTGPVRNRRKEYGDREWYSDLPCGENEVCVYENDFLRSADYAAADWVITSTEAGGSTNSTIAISQAGDCGTLVITPGITENDSEVLQQSNDGGTTVQEPWRLDAGKKLWCEIDVSLADADQQDVFVGLNISDTTPLTTTDRVGFQINDEDASILCKTEKDSTETSTDSGKDASDATTVKLGFRWDGVSKVDFFVDRAKVATHTTNIPDDENLAITLYNATGEGAANALTVDKIYVAQER